MENCKIVIIDEDAKNVKDLEGILAAIGHCPVVLNDTLSAVDSIAQWKPDVILLELRMPHKNGFELAEEINRVFETARIPIIAMSQYFKNEFNLLLNLCGISRYLKKPFYNLDVIWAIENELGESDTLNYERLLARQEQRSNELGERWDLRRRYYNF